MSTPASYSRTLIREWSGYEQVAIWDNCKWSVRLYEDRAVYKGHTVRWATSERCASRWKVERKVWARVSKYLWRMVGR